MRYPLNHKTNVAVFGRMGVETGIDLYKILDAAEIAQNVGKKDESCQ